MGFTLLLDMFLFGLNMIRGAELNHNLKRTSKREQLQLSLIEEALETSGMANYVLPVIHVELGIGSTDINSYIEEGVGGVLGASKRDEEGCK